MWKKVLIVSLILIIIIIGFHFDSITGKLIYKGKKFSMKNLFEKAPKQLKGLPTELEHVHELQPLSLDYSAISKIQSDKLIKIGCIEDNQYCNRFKKSRNCANCCSNYSAILNATTGYCLPPSNVNWIDVAVIVDDSSEYDEPDSYFYNLMSKANETFYNHTNLSFNIVRLIHLSSNDYGGPLDLQTVYLEDYPPPEYMLIFTRNDALSAENGGYGGFAIGGIFVSPEYCNRLNSIHGKRKILVGVVDAASKMFLCGYNETRFLPGGWDTPTVSSVSIDGQCANQPDIPCVFEGNASRCSIWRERRGVGDEVSIISIDEEFVVRTIIHELGHSFGTEGNFDHFETEQCVNRTNSTIDWGNIPSNAVYDYLGLCPDLFPRISESYTLCSNNLWSGPCSRASTCSEDHKSCISESGLIVTQCGEGRYCKMGFYYNAPPPRGGCLPKKIYGEDCGHNYECDSGNCGVFDLCS